VNATAGTILGFLLQKPMSGYELTGEITKAVGNFWNVTQSQIYREIQTLAAAGMIKPGETGARARRRYRLTTAGKDAFEAWIKRDPSGSGPLIRDPFFLRVFFADKIDRESMIRMTRQQRALHESRLAGFRRLEQEIDRAASKRSLALGIRYEEAMLAWIATLPWK
jgi:DNA-binding PadR family transcriptional regulator